MDNIEGRQMGIIDSLMGIRSFRKNVINEFERIYYDSMVWANGRTKWLGTTILKCPTDVWIYQEILYDLKPDVIIETGTFNGGSALFLASILDLIGNGEIITIDVEDRKDRPQHKRISYLLGSSVSKEVLDDIEKRISDKQKVMVILDSDHRKDHVLNELRLYSKFVTFNSYLIVEDSNVNGHPVQAAFGPGPMEAIEEFIRDSKDFTVDNDKEKFLLTFNPKGYLKKTGFNKC
jgi:cephalosporin hydroxylase